MSLETQFAIICNDERGIILTGVRSAKFWRTLDDLVLTLLQSSNFSQEAILFSWKSQDHHVASAREAYSWRAALDEIKNSDLTEKCSKFRQDSEKFLFLTDKPAMLKIAGEVTNSLLHSNTRGHRISFSSIQRTSNEPS
jgi:hypothetical protein